MQDFKAGLKEQDIEKLEFNTKQWVLVSEAAKMLSISPFTIRRWLREGLLESKKFGGRWFIPKEVFDKHLLKSNNSGVKNE